jgi:hypothetical protein
MAASTMSSRERMLAAMTRREHDHVPFSPYINPGPRLGPPFFWLSQFHRADVMLEIGLDPTIDVWLPYPQPHPDVQIKTWRDGTGPDALLTKEYHTPAGVLRQAVRESGEWCDAALHSMWTPTTMGTDLRQHCNMELLDDWNVSRRTEPWVKSREDLQKLRYIIRPPDGYVLDEWIMDAKRAAEFAKSRDILLAARRTIVGDAYQWFCDIEEFSCWMIEEPEFVEEFLAILQDWSIRLTDLALEVGVDLVQRRGWYETPMFWGPKYWERYLAPGIEAESRLVHEAGKLHCYLLPEDHGAYAGAFKNMDVDILMGVDPRKMPACDMPALFDQLGDTKSFWGGVNAEVTLGNGDRIEIDHAVETAIQSLGENNGLILGATIFEDVPPQNILTMIDSWKKYREI